MLSRASTSKSHLSRFIHSICVLGLATTMSQASSAQICEPDARNSLPIKPNPTATVTPVCHKLGDKDYSEAFHASCYSELKQAVVVLVSGNAGTITGRQIANHIITEFEKSYIPSVGFLRFKERDKVAVVFLLNGDAYGPYSGENWQEGFNTLKTHSAEAWYN